MDSSTPQRVFISYVREDSDEVDDLRAALEAANIDVWIDKAMLFPGQDWKLEIRKAIEHGSLAFVAVFSDNSVQRSTTVQNDELLTAAEAFALRPVGSQWLFPVRLGDVEIPNVDLGGRRSLSSLHYTDLFGKERTSNLVKLVTTLAKVVHPAVSATTIAAQISSSELPAGNAQRLGQVKTLLRDPNGDIALEELVVELAQGIRRDLEDEVSFPLTLAEDVDSSSLAWVERVEETFQRYEQVVEPLAQILIMAGRWGRDEHEVIWGLAMDSIASTVSKPSGHQFLLRLRHYPLVYLMHVVTIAAMNRDNYGVVRAAVLSPKVTDHRVTEPLPLVAYSNLTSVDGGSEAWIFQAISVLAEGGGERTAEFIELVQRGRARRYEPFSDFLEQRMWRLFEAQYQNRERFEVAFDEAEILLDSLYWDERKTLGLGAGGIGGGRYTYRYEYVESPPETRMLAAFQGSGERWKPITVGLFGNDTGRAAAALSQVVDVASRLRGSRW